MENPFKQTDDIPVVKKEFLSKLPFTDLYVRIDSHILPSRFRPDITKIKKDKYKEGNYKVPESYEHHMQQIRDNLMKLHKKGQSDGTITYEGMRMRFVIMRTENETWASLRAVPLEVPNFDKLGHNEDFVKAMKSLAGKSGLIIIGGKTGDGKTTTAVSYLKYLLEKKRGLLFTIEDPPEYALMGEVSDGAFCIQYEIKNNDDWSTASRVAMRSRPDYILFGEIRTPEAAENLLKTLTSGHLVVATIHAGQVSDTVAALMQMAENKLGRVARDNLADRLLCAVHQTMTENGPSVEYIIPSTKQNTDKDQVINAIKLGKNDQLANMSEKGLPKKEIERLNLKKIGLQPAAT